MANTKAVSNEEIIAALLQHGTIKDAAAAAGTTPRTIYDRMNDREFRAEYMEAKNDIIRKAVFTINEKLSAAIDTIADIMTDADNNPAIRL
ncbi:MAG: helix-turn-helix domain-containing protein [Clostridia bacterium]|nr:helix-turn-helix domain-containing protein [Clostridia bacterium]